MTLEEMHSTFRKMLQDDPFDKATRMAFSDWLEDHGMDDECKLNRDWTPEKYRESVEFMERLGRDIGSDYGSMSMTFTAHDMIYAGHEALKWGWGSMSTPGYDGEEWYENEDNRKAFWQHWQVLTCIPVSEDQIPDTVFSCLC